MNTQKSTPKIDNAPVETANDKLDLRWRFFKSRYGQLLVACFDSAPIEQSENFTEIDRKTYAQLLEKQVKS